MALHSSSTSTSQLPCRTTPCTVIHIRQKHRRQLVVTAVLATPREAQIQKRSTLEALQSARTVTAVKTPYLENGRIDLESFDRLLEQQALGGVEGVIVGGTTGEGQVCCCVQSLDVAPALTHDA